MTRTWPVPRVPGEYTKRPTFLQRIESGIHTGVRRRLQVERDAWLAELNELDRSLEALTSRRVELLNRLDTMRDRLWPEVPTCRGRRPPALDRPPLPPMVAGVRLTGGRELRGICLTMLGRQGAMALPDMHALLHTYGYGIAGEHTVKTLADAMAYEVRCGRAVRVRRGVYDLAPGMQRYSRRRGRDPRRVTDEVGEVAPWSDVPVDQSPWSDVPVDEPLRTDPDRWIPASWPAPPRVGGVNPVPPGPAALPTPELEAPSRSDPAPPAQRDPSPSEHIGAESAQILPRQDAQGTSDKEEGGVERAHGAAETTHGGVGETHGGGAVGRTARMRPVPDASVASMAMKALRSFTVRPSLPPALAPLEALAMNLRWSWDIHTRELFRWVDPEEWDAVVHDPVRLLGNVSKARLAELVDDMGFLRALDTVSADLDHYLTRNAWFQGRADSPLRSVAYFSPEFGISEALPQYSGGLGILAGDHLKAASDLGLPLIGIGLMYRNGYFRQALNVEGWQEQRYPNLDPYGMALTLQGDTRVQLDLGGETMFAQIWKAEVGRTVLYLLDTDVDENSDTCRGVTDRLYGGDSEHRLQQEILLGIGGVRALRALGVETQVFHTNEGHAGFLGLELVREHMVDHGLRLVDAIEAVRAGSVFTTHTPVPAGIDRFPTPLIEKYFGSWAAEVGVSLDELLALGREPEDEAGARFNMAVMGFRLAARANGVARLHGAVSRAMFQPLWPDVPVEEVPIGSITNGVHARTWVSPEMDDLLTRHVHPHWGEASPSDWSRIEDATDDEIWRVREQGKDRLIALVRDKIRRSAMSRGQAPSDVAWADEVFDSRALTIGFARRFATYKRATLLLSQPERLRAMLTSTDRPVQFVFAGKAHPADDHGKEMIRQIVAFSSDPEVRHRFVFLDDYDIAIARTMYHGCDVWLNNPRRPQEACGTSGMKAALNGQLNLSILDGWWDECYDGENGWAISSAEYIDDDERRDELEANSLFDLLEREVVPRYYDQYEGRVPRRWVRRVKHTLAGLGPYVSASRMVKDYATDLYEPAAAHTDRMAADGYARARALADWKDRVLEGWRGVHVDSVESDSAMTAIGDDRTVEAVVSLGGLSGDDVEVQLLHGIVGQGDELESPTITAMTAVGPTDDIHVRYRGAFACEEAGRYGFTVRVVPSHPDLAASAEMGRIALA